MATLILSRKDGSVIRATGSLASGKRPSSSRSDTNGDVEAKQQDEAKGEPDLKPQQDSGVKRTDPAHLLAASVAAFVSAAGTMSNAFQTSLAGESGNTDLYSGWKESGQDQAVAKDKEEDARKAQQFSDVQLLRMRTKKHEVIIFPDPKFLCCVIQEVGRNGATPEDSRTKS